MKLGIVVLLFIVIGILVPKDGSLQEYDIKDLPETFEADFSKLIISEIVTNNNGVYVNENNEQCDYIELYNGTDKDIDLSGYGLSDDNKKIKWAFGNVIIPAKSYLVVNCTGNNEEGLNAPFCLSSAGNERVILVNKKMKVIDGVDTVSLSANSAMVRDEKGNWYVSSYATPGYENSIAGQKAYIESLKGSEEVELVINEFLPKNKGNFINEYEDTPSFIEFKNVSDKTISLKDYSVSSDVSAPFKKALDDVLLLPNETFAFYLGKKEIGRENYLDFSLTNTNGSVILSKKGKIIQEITYCNLENGYSYQYSSGSYAANSTISCGFDNDVEGIEKFQKKYLKNSKDLIINEVMNTNKQYLAQNGNQYYDWIELYNNTDKEISLNGYCLSTNLNDKEMYPLPDQTLKPYGYLILMCSGNTNLSNSSYQHTGFKISDSEGIYLSKEGKLIDSVFISNMPYGYSYGRNDSVGYFFISSPTPGEDNESGYSARSSDPQISFQGGVFNDLNEIKVEITGPNTIYYTTDGSLPNKDSEKVSGPIFIDKTTVIRARCFENGKMVSNTAVESYIINENHTLPVASLVMNPDDFSYVNKNAWEEGLEKQAHLEFYEEDGSFSTNCSYSLFGGNARSYSKKSFCVRFDREWGAHDLEYQVFDNRDNAVFDALVFRTGSSDWDGAIIRDILGTSLVDDYTDLDVLAYKPCILYVNGKYWGIFNIREKTGAQYISSHYNVSEESVNISRIDSDVTCGSIKGYSSLRSYCRNHDLSVDEYYNYVAEHADLVNVADYWISEGFVTNNDLLNVRVFNSSELEEGRYHYIFYDLDFAWYNVDRNWYTVYIGNSNYMTNHSYENDLIYNLLQNRNFRKLWLERLAYNLNNTWSEENVLNRIDEIYQIYEPEIERNQKRWNLTVKDFTDGLDDLREFTRKRTYYYLRDTKDYFHLSDKEMKEYFGDLWA